MDAVDAVLTCALTRWSPGLGDATSMGIFTVFAYAFATLLGALVLVHSGKFPVPSRRRERLFWLGTTVALAFLCVNKELDLQSFFTAVGRCVSQLGGWYDQRRPFQAAVIAGLVTASLLTAGGIAVLLRGTLKRNGLALVGMLAIIAFVLSRAVGFTLMDSLIGMRIAGWRLNWVMELGGIALVSLGALWTLWTLGRLRQRSRSDPCAAAQHSRPVAETRRS